jgi:hypothetical protein
VDSSQYSAPISRVPRVALGLVVTIIGAALLGFFGLGLYRLIGGLPSTSIIVILFIVGALGLALCVLGLRLITGKRRRDGGLFSPWALRFGGVIFLFGPVAALINRSWFGLVEAGVSLSAAVACFALANRRAEAAADLGAPNNRWRGP